MNFSTIMSLFQKPKYEPRKYQCSPVDDSKFDEMKPSEFRDVIVLRDFSYLRRQVNVPRRIEISDDIEWGYLGTGPRDLGLNILLHFTNEDRMFCERNINQFLIDFISKIPKRGGVIPAAQIFQWIESRRFPKKS